ncbi:MAG TPA: molybdopterin cofactor-binding domain-containing protein [Dehalococcoidia bacterium]|nr:molybdopterin cofactor-binding domain-containing protein [Dehalococcoidia bacterium]
MSITASVAPGFPASQSGYGSRAYGNTQPEHPRARWLFVGPDGSVTAYAGKVEYGQNIRTGFAMEVADELHVPLSRVEVVLGDTESTPWDMGTFGSQSTARVGLQLRQAAATARQVLLELASNQLDLPPEELVATDGVIASRSDPGHAVSYGELVSKNPGERELDEQAALLGSDEFRVMGHAQRRTDAEARVTGRAVYSQDVLLPGMLFARILRAPAAGAQLASVDVSAAERMPRVRTVVREGDLVAVLAEDDESADRAIEALEARWEGGDTGSHLDIPRILIESKRDPMSVQEAGDVAEALRKAEHRLEASYYVPHVANLPMEPRAAVAQWEGDQLTVWAGTQRPFGLRSELATHFRLSESQVRVISPEIGGAFGTKSWYPAGLEAARLARIAGRPVRVAYSRQEDTVAGTFRPAALIEIRSGFKSDGTITAWEFNAYHAGPFPHIARRGSETPYNIGNVAVAVYSAKSLVRVGSYRSLGGAVNHFATESHVDEIAAALGTDPVELRLRNLSHARFRRVLENAADAFGWEAGGSPSQRGVGVAIGTDVGSYVGTCLELKVAGSEIQVQRVVTALDCGLAVNPEGAKNQVEGSTIMGLGAALYEGVEVRNGVILNSTLTRYQVPRMNNAPDIEVVLVGDPGEPSTGAGEPGIVTVAPAVANAVFDQTGGRLRELPLQRHLPGAP